METSRVALRGEQPDYIHAVTANVGYKKKSIFVIHTMVIAGL